MGNLKLPTQAISLSDSEGAVYLRLPVCPIGEKLQHPVYGELDFSAALAEKLIENFRAYGDDVPVDYDHGTDAPFAHQGAGRAAGWVRRPKALRVEDSFLVAYAEPTPAAAQAVRDGEWRLVSPSLSMDWENPKTGERQGPTLFALALTNRPFIRGMPPAEIIDRSTVALSAAGGSMDAGKVENSAAATASPEAVRLSALEAKTEALVAALSAAKTEAAAKDEKIRKLQDAMDAQAQATRRADEASVVDAAIAAGKFPAAAREELLKWVAADPEGFKKVCDAMPSAIPMSAVGRDAPEAPRAGQAARDAQRAAILSASDIHQKAQKISPSAALQATVLANPKAIFSMKESN